MKTATAIAKEYAAKGFEVLREVTISSEHRVDALLMKGDDIVKALEGKLMDLTAKTYLDKATGELRRGAIYGKLKRYVRKAYEYSDTLTEVVPNTATNDLLSTELNVSAKVARPEHFKQFVALARQAFKEVTGERVALGVRQATAANNPPKASLATRKAGPGGHVELEALGMFVGTALAGLQMWEGGEEIGQGKTALGSISVAEGSVGLFLTWAPRAAGVTAGAGAGALFAVGTAAAVSVGLAAESARAAVKGEKTPVEKLDRLAGTSFGDVHSLIQSSSYVPTWYKRYEGAGQEIAQDVYYNLFLKYKCLAEATRPGNRKKEKPSWNFKVATYNSGCKAMTSSDCTMNLRYLDFLSTPMHARKKSSTTA
jgi:hypothetical protein